RRRGRVVGAAHTGIFTSMTRSGQPVTLPVWFIAADRVVYFSTPASAKKVARVQTTAPPRFWRRPVSSGAS
ncbi:MAG TPA: hypothetical protein VG205_06940, partial [Acidimicrobiales bacterium]|nr:hypothetical protein [Acidimicrobiales bacterium]